MEQFIQKYPYNQLFENNADSHFYMKIGGTVYDVTTHYDPKGRQCVLDAIIIANISSASAIGMKDEEVPLWNNSFKNIRIINFLKTMPTRIFI